MKRVALVFLLAIVGVAALLVWRRSHPEAASSVLTLYGNVDLRQVELAFQDAERIDAILVREGDRVRRGQVLARLNTHRLEPQVAQARA
jgi:HlyD family secretion protein